MSDTPKIIDLASLGIFKDFQDERIKKQLEEVSYDLSKNDENEIVLTDGTGTSSIVKLDTASAEMDGLQSKEHYDLVENYRDIVTHEISLLSSDWNAATKSCTKEIQGISKYNYGTINIKEESSSDQINAVIASKMTVTCNGDILTFKCLDDVPAVDIDIIFTIGTSMNIVEIPDILKGEIGKVTEKAIVDALGYTPANISDVPNEITVDTITEWGFTKNTGNYNKPEGGIPFSDLSEDVKTSLGLSDYATKEDLETLMGEDVDETLDTIKELGEAIKDNKNLIDAIHSHSNKPVIDKFTESENGELLFNGAEIGKASTNIYDYLPKTTENILKGTPFANSGNPAYAFENGGTSWIAQQNKTENYIGLKLSVPSKVIKLNVEFDSAILSSKGKVPTIYAQGSVDNSEWITIADAFTLVPIYGGLNRTSDINIKEEYLECEWNYVRLYSPDVLVISSSGGCYTSIRGICFYSQISYPGKNDLIEDVKLGNTLSLANGFIDVKINNNSSSDTALWSGKKISDELNKKDSFINKTTLNKFSETEDGELLYNGKAIKAEEQDLSDYAKIESLHGHDNKNVIDTITEAKMAEWDEAAKIWVGKSTDYEAIADTIPIGTRLFFTDDDQAVGDTGGSIIININGGTEVYSTEETIIGKWIDGKPIYRRVLPISNLDISNSTWTQTNISINDNHIESVINGYGGYIVDGVFRTVYPLLTSSNTDSFVYVAFQTPRNAANDTCNLIILEYTKTTDALNSFTNDMMNNEVIAEDEMNSAILEDKI